MHFYFLKVLFSFSVKNCKSLRYFTDNNKKNFDYLFSHEPNKTLNSKLNQFDNNEFLC